MEKYKIKETKDYEELVKLFVESELEFSEEEPVPTDLVKCWRATYSGSNNLIGGVVLAKREGQFIIDGIAVIEELRKSGVGKELLQVVIDKVREEGGKTLFLVARAPGFFKKNGFTVVERNEAPMFFECFTCPQYKITCHPEVMALEVK